MMSKTNRRQFFASAAAFGASLTPVIGSAIENATGVSLAPVDPTQVPHAVGGRVSITRPGEDFDRFVHVSLFAGPQGFAGATVTGQPNGPDASDLLNGWREVDVIAGRGTAKVAGESAPESAEAFVRRLLAAAAEVAQPDM